MAIRTRGMRYQKFLQARVLSGWCPAPLLRSANGLTGAGGKKTTLRHKGIETDKLRVFELGPRFCGRLIMCDTDVITKHAGQILILKVTKKKFLKLFTTWTWLACLLFYCGSKLNPVMISQPWCTYKSVIIVGQLIQLQKTITRYADELYNNIRKKSDVGMNVCMIQTHVRVNMAQFMWKVNFLKRFPCSELVS